MSVVVIFLPRIRKRKRIIRNRNPTTVPPSTCTHRQPRRLLYLRKLCTSILPYRILLSFSNSPIPQATTLRATRLNLRTLVCKRRSGFIIRTTAPRVCIICPMAQRRFSDHDQALFRMRDQVAWTVSVVLKVRVVFRLV